MSSYEVAKAVEKPVFQSPSVMGAGIARTNSPASDREIARIQAKLVSAKMFPRDPAKALEKIEMECSRRAVAEHAIYQFARGGSSITGPSIRLAESIARSWGNIDYGFEEVEVGHGSSKVRTYAIDYEANTSAERTFYVEHKRDTRSGSALLTNSRDIYEAVANAAARRMRACILEVIPGDVVDYAVAKCQETLQSTIDLTPELIQNMLECFKRDYGITKAMIEARIQRKVETIGIELFLSLDRIYTSLRDGIATVEDFFDTTITEAKTESKPEPKPEPAPKAGMTPSRQAPSPEGYAAPETRIYDEPAPDGLFDQSFNPF